MRPSLERELRLLEDRLRAELRAELDLRLLALTRHVDAEIAELTQRVDTVHSRALRALTHRTERGAP
jgi:hypothetical protein